MFEQELEKLLKNTAITLSDDEKAEFVSYFAGMKKMLDEFYQFDFPQEEIQKEEKSLTLFDEQADFQGLDLITTNVAPEKIQNHSLEIVSHFGK